LLLFKKRSLKTHTSGLSSAKMVDVLRAWASRLVDEVSGDDFDAAAMAAAFLLLVAEEEERESGDSSGGIAGQGGADMLLDLPPESVVEARELLARHVSATSSGHGGESLASFVVRNCPAVHPFDPRRDLAQWADDWELRAKEEEISNAEVQAGEESNPESDSEDDGDVARRLSQKQPSPPPPQQQQQHASDPPAAKSEVPPCPTCWQRDGEHLASCPQSRTANTGRLCSECSAHFGENHQMHCSLWISGAIVGESSGPACPECHESGDHRASCSRRPKGATFAASTSCPTCWQRDGEHLASCSAGLAAAGVGNCSECYTRAGENHKSYCSNFSTASAPSAAPTGVAGGGHRHNFKTKSYSKPTYCASCKWLLLGLVKQGKQCTKCGIDVHSKTKCMQAGFQMSCLN
jgi:Phorbol esters/diacylglycerol binding domain (C1 domain)